MFASNVTKAFIGAVFCIQQAVSHAGLLVQPRLNQAPVESMYFEKSCNAGIDMFLLTKQLLVCGNVEE